MMAAAVIAASLAVVALVVFAIRFGTVSGNLAQSEADRDRLESVLRELVADENTEAAALRESLTVTIEELARARKEIARRRRPGDALGRLKLLSQDAGKTSGSDHQD